MLARLARAPKAMVLLLFGVVFGMAWAATGGNTTAAPPPKGGGTSITAGPGLTASPNPITSTGTLSVDFPTVDTRYLRQTGGTLSGDLAFTGNAQLIAPRIENAASAPAGAAAGRLWFDTTDLRLKMHDGSQWIPLPQLFSAQNHPVQILGTPDVFEDLDCVVTFTLPSEQQVLVEGGAAGQMSCLINPNQFPGMTATADLEIRLQASVDGGPAVPLANWNASFLNVGQTSVQTKLAQASPLLLPAGTHTMRLKAMRRGTIAQVFPMQPGEYECRISNLWVRVQRP